MTRIIKAGEKHVSLLSQMGALTFIQSHGHSAKQEDINSYVAEKYNEVAVRKELQHPANIYHIIYYNDQPAGYSKIIFDCPYATVIPKTLPNWKRFIC